MPVTDETHMPVNLSRITPVLSQIKHHLERRSEAFHSDSRNDEACVWTLRGSKKAFTPCRRHGSSARDLNSYDVVASPSCARSALP